MTTPHQRTRAVLQTRDFLSRLASADARPVLSEVQEQARRLLYHYPEAWHLSRLHALAPHEWGSVRAVQEGGMRGSGGVAEVRRALDFLAEAHPAIFHGKPPSVGSFLPWGWLALADKLCDNIENLLDAQDLERLEVTGVKAKFGALRVYLHLRGSALPAPSQEFSEGAGAKLAALVDAAAEESIHTCLRCGAPGSMRQLGSRVATLCDDHYATDRGW